MIIFFYLLIFLVSCIFLYISGDLVVNGLIKVARFLGWREFVVSFFVMAFAASLPNFFVGITSALRQVPELSFGDVVGNNLVALTVAIALAVLIGKKDLPIKSRTVRTTAIFTIIAAILPLILIFDNILSRADGLVLIGLFIFYCFWLFSKKERFIKVYNGHSISVIKEFKIFLKNFFGVIFGILILIGAAQGIVFSAKFFAYFFNVSIVLIGILITGLGSALPEIYFAIISAKKGKEEEIWMILGDLMGAVIIPASLVLGLVSLIHPIQILNPLPLLAARFFLIVAALAFLFFLHTDRKISRKEAFCLLGLYLAFLLVEILIK